MSGNEIKLIPCPICTNTFQQSEIESHVNKCIFLNCNETNTDRPKRKRTPSPKREASLFSKSPRTSSSSSKPLNNKVNTTTDTPSSSTHSNREISAVKEAQITLSSPTPLAKQLQPKTLDEFFGQTKILGEGSVLRSLLQKGEIPNMILWGPPGCGKTSLSGVINAMCKKDPKKLKFTSLCAATCGIKEVQTIVTNAKNERKFGRQTILFMDEIHRFNKKQQDTFLMCVEKGEIILIGATTENPSFSINNALLSRCRVIVLEKLQPDDLYAILENAVAKLDVDVVDTENPCAVIKSENIAVESSVLQWLADISDGDARIALGNLQLTLQHCSRPEKVITVDDVKEGIKKSHMLYDRVGEEHYNIISAMHKSIRGSDENAALYWTTRMIVSGEDPLYIARRLVRAASEDIGNADPHAMPLAIATMQGCQLLGMPEADVLLAQCAIYLARAPKSREADSALGRAKQLINNYKGVQPAVPMHIRNAPTKLMKDLGYGRLENGAEFTFMPPDLKDVNFFD